MKKAISLITLLCLLGTGLGIGPAYSQESGGLVLPAPGRMVALSPAYRPPVLKGIKLDPHNPFRFHFFVDTGDSQISKAQLKTESARLIKYFLAALTVPEKDLWVNLSPYEKNRIVPGEFGQTEMGRDLLAEDYILKQITSSLIYPESPIGKEFWKKVYAQAQAKYGTTNIPINTFNKVWIVPDKALVYENGPAAFVLKSHLKVMLEEDYLSLQKHRRAAGGTHSLGSQIIRNLVLPQLEREVNHGKNFAQLRQVFYSLILATWYKNKVKDSLFNKVYSNRSKLGGINVSPKQKDEIYQEYIRAFKKGVFNYIKEVPDKAAGTVVPRKYFSGGVTAMDVSRTLTTVDPGHVDPAMLTNLLQTKLIDVDGNMDLLRHSPHEMILEQNFSRHIAQKMQGAEKTPAFDAYPDITIGKNDYPVEITPDYRLYRVGPLVIVSLAALKQHDFNSWPTVYPQLIEQQLRHFNSFYLKRRNNIFVVPPYSVTSLGDLSNIRQDGATLDSHTMLTIAAMLDNAGKFKDATVVDIGAGYGLLSQIALSLGAKKVNLFENVEAFNAIAVAGLHAAGWMPDKFAVYNADMTNDRHLQDAANIVGKDAENVIVLDNTGMTYGDLNDKSLRLAKEFKHLKLIINAGHYAGAPSVLGRFYEQNQKVMQSAEQIFHQNGWQYQRADYFPHGPNEVGVAAYVVQPDKAMNAQDNIKKALDLSGPTDKKDADVLHLLDKLDIEEGDPLLMIGPGKMVAHVLFSALQKAKVEVMEAPLFPDNSGYAAAIDRAKAMDPAIARNILTRRMSANIQASKYDCVVMINLDGIPEEQTKQITQLALKAVKSEKFLIVGAAQAGMIEKLDGSFKKIGKKEDVVLLQHTIPIQNKIAARLDWEFITTAQLESYIHAFKSGNFPQDEMTLYKRIDHEISVAGLDGEERIKMPEEKYLSILEESLQIMKSSSIWSPHQSNAAMASRPAVLAVPLPLENQKPLNIPLEVGEKKLITIIKKRSKTELVLERKGPSAFYLNGRLLSGRMTISKNHDIKVDIFVAGQKLEIVNLLNEPPFLFQARHFPLEAYGTVRILTSGTDPKDNTVLDFFVDRQENDRLLLYGDGIEASSAPSITVHKGQTKLMIRSAEDGLWIENLTRGSDLYIEIDQAMAAKTSKSADLKGGIDFNPTSLNMQVRKQGKGFRFKFNGRVVDAAGITGAVFDIRTMTPVSGLSKLLEATTS